MAAKLSGPPASAGCLPFTMRIISDHMMHHPLLCQIGPNEQAQQRGTGELEVPETNHAPPSAAAPGSASCARRPHTYCLSPGDGIDGLRVLGGDTGVDDLGHCGYMLGRPTLGLRVAPCDGSPTS